MASPQTHRSPRSSAASAAARSADRTAGSAPSLVLARTDIPGVYRNSSGVLTDEKGLALSWRQVKEADDARWMETYGSVPKTPAELLRAVSMDPRHSLDTRLSAARQAAPYFDMRMPLRVEATGHVNALDLNAMAKMSTTERKTLLELLKKAGVEL